MPEVLQYMDKANVLKFAKNQKRYVVLLCDFGITCQGHVIDVSDIAVRLVGSKSEDIFVDFERIVVVTMAFPGS